mgnify:CR=1 FL=1
MQFFKIATYVQIARLYGSVYYAACAFCHICTTCGLRLWVCGLSGCLCVLDLYGRLESESVSVFDGFVYL